MNTNQPIAFFDRQSVISPKTLPEKRRRRFTSPSPHMHAVLSRLKHAKIFAR